MQAEGGREPLTGEPLRLIGTWAQFKDVKGGANGKGKPVTVSRKEILMTSGM